MREHVHFEAPGGDAFPGGVLAPAIVLNLIADPVSGNGFKGDFFAGGGLSGTAF